MACEHFRQPDATAATHLVGGTTFNGKEFIPETDLTKIMPGGVCLASTGVATVVRAWVEKMCQSDSNSSCPLRNSDGVDHLLQK